MQLIHLMGGCFQARFEFDESGFLQALLFFRICGHLQQARLQSVFVLIPLALFYRQLIQQLLLSLLQRLRRARPFFFQHLESVAKGLNLHLSFLLDTL